MNIQTINLPSKPLAKAEPTLGKSVFISGRGIITHAAIAAADKMIERLREINGVLVTTDDPYSLDRYLIQRAALLGVRTVVHGLAHRPNKDLPTSATYTRYLNPERLSGGLAWYKRNLVAASSADQAVVIDSDPRHEASQRKFVAAIRRETGRSATLFPAR